MVHSLPTASAEMRRRTYVVPIARGHALGSRQGLCGGRKSLRTAGFTFLELTVVVAVLLILATLLYRTGAAAYQRARQLQCVNNLRQIGVALLAYAEVHDGRGPRFPVAPDGAVEPYVSLAAVWDPNQGDIWVDHRDVLIDYTASPSIWVCPLDDLNPHTYRGCTFTQSPGYQGDAVRRWSYGINRALVAGLTGSKGERWWATGIAGNLDSAAEPSRMIAFYHSIPGVGDWQFEMSCSGVNEWMLGGGWNGWRSHGAEGCPLGDDAPPGWANHAGVFPAVMLDGSTVVIRAHRHESDFSVPGGLTNRYPLQAVHGLSWSGAGLGPYVWGAHGEAMWTREWDYESLRR